MAAFYCVQLNRFKVGLSFWSSNLLYNVSLLSDIHCPADAAAAAAAVNAACLLCSHRLGVSNMRLSQQYLVKEPFLLLMA